LYFYGFSMMFAFCFPIEARFRHRTGRVCRWNYEGTIEIDSIVSDHKVTYISLIWSVNCKRAYQRKIWDYKNADFDRLNLMIHESTCNWSSIIGDAINVTEATENFTSHFLSCVRECVSEKCITIRPKDKPWFDSVLCYVLTITISATIEIGDSNVDKSWWLYQTVTNLVVTRGHPVDRGIFFLLSKFFLRLTRLEFNRYHRIIPYSIVTKLGYIVTIRI
jgi:hypothetical protein